MKVKKSVIFISFLIFLVVLSLVYLSKNDDIITKNVTSNSKKYFINTVSSNDFVERKDLECDAYNKNYASQNVIVNDENGHNIYIVQGCAWDFNDILKANSHGISKQFKEEVCNARKEVIENKYPNSEISINEFNNSRCVTEFGFKKLEMISVDVCNYFGVKYNGEYTQYDFIYGENEPHICEQNTNSLKGQTGIVMPSAINDHNAPIYLVQGCSWKLNDLVNNTLGNSCINEDLKKEVCKIHKSFVQDNYMENEAYVTEFNTSCIDTGILDESERLTFVENIVNNNFVDVIFRAYDSYGLECIEESTSTYTSFTSDNNECTYRFKKNEGSNTNINIPSNKLPITTNIKRILTGGKFTGWKRTNESCNININTNFSVSEDITEIFFDACYESVSLSDESKYALYKDCDGSYITESNVKQKNNVSNTALLKSQISTKKTFIGNTLKDTVSYGNTFGSSFNINKYCKIECTENFEYSYPSIIGTVKSGTYFDLLSYPEVKTSLKCDEVFDYNTWENNYKSSIKDEKNAWKNKKNVENINSLSVNNAGVCCLSYSETGACAVYGNYYGYSVTMYEYNDVGEYGSISNRPVSGSSATCWGSSDMAKVSYISALKSSYGYLSSVDYNGIYNTKKNNRLAMEQANKDCRNALTIESINTDNFYNIKDTSSINFYYESDDRTLSPGNDLGLSSKYVQEKLEATNKYVYDSKNENIYNSTKPFSISDNGVNINFNAYNNTSFSRNVIRNYVFDKSISHKQYYSKYHTGEIINQDNTERSKAIYLGYIYPIRLDLNGRRNVYFSINVNTNLNYGVVSILNNSNDVNDLGVYKCDYEVSNDIIIEDKLTADSGDYKKNFYIRSISTSSVDPNNRYEKGLLGANWANKKGQDLIHIIESKAKNKNTYNPSNLEYSFTLNAQTIDVIKEYNKNLLNSGLGYDDFNLDCNDMGGECKSKFLNGLKSGSLGVGMSVNNVNAIMKNNTWKYYINGNWLMTNSLISSNVNDWRNINSTNNSTIPNISDFDECIDNDGVGGDFKSTYDCIYHYVNEGVLP